MSKTITLIPGDGIGPEVTRAVVRVLDAAGFTPEWESFSAGAEAVKEHGTTLPQPLLDHRLIEFAATLPESLRIRRGQGKWLLKHAMERYLPHEVLYRPKQGFVTPIAQWLRGPLAGEARAIGRGAALARTGWFDSGLISTLAEAHISGRSDHSRPLWQLLMLDRSLTRLGAA